MEALQLIIFMKDMKKELTTGLFTLREVDGVTM
jgi:hypothetical protein